MSRFGVRKAVALSLAGIMSLADVVWAGEALRESASPQAAAKVEDLAWMAGDWQTTPGKMQSEEHWTQPAGGTLIGMSRTLAGGKTVFFEYLRIEARADGIYYVAHPKARPGTDFKLTRTSTQEVVFENPAHDFPKRIIYRKNADGSLTARVEGDGTEKEKPQEFHFTPMK
jgi:hypothetical protein